MRFLATVATAVAVAVFGGSNAGAQVTGVQPGASTSTSTTTTKPATSSTTTTPTTAPTTTAPPASTTVPQNQTRILPLPAPATPPATTGITGPNGPGPVATTSTTTNGQPPTASTVPPASLSPGQVDEVLRNLQRSGANNTAALVEALKPLQNYGMTLEEALTLGMGQFPLLGVANWTDDWLDPRAGPPPHDHQGNDLFAAFDTPVRAPVDGVVRFEDAGLGGKGAFVTAPDGTYYYMAHLNSFHRDVANGATVKQGQVIGYNGDSGNAKGGAPHVHFEIHPRGGAAVNPKPIIDGWVADAMSRVGDLIASFQPKAGSDTTADGGVPQILVATGMTRRFSAPSLPVPGRGRASPDFNSAVLGPLTPPVLAPLFDRAATDR